MVGHGRQAAPMGVGERVGWQRVEGRGVGSGLSKRESHRRLVVIDDICEAVEDEAEGEGGRYKMEGGLG